MCLACMEYLKGRLSDSEFKRNLREYRTDEHDPKALEKAEISVEEVRKQPSEKKKIGF